MAWATIGDGSADPAKELALRNDARLLKTLLFDVSPLDPLVFSAAAAAMLAIGLLAAFLPASRAARPTGHSIPA